MLIIISSPMHRLHPSEVAVLHRRYAGVFACIVSVCSARLKSGTVKTETKPWTAVFS